jgi:hypothetical protein
MRVVLPVGWGGGAAAGAAGMRSDLGKHLRLAAVLRLPLCALRYVAP